MDERRLLALDDSAHVPGVDERPRPRCATRRPFDVLRAGGLDSLGQTVVRGSGDDHVPASPRLVGDGVFDVLADAAVGGLGHVEDGEWVTHCARAHLACRDRHPRVTMVSA